MADVMSVQCQPSEIQGRIQDFPEGDAPTPKKEATTYYSAKCPKKLQENEENWAGEGAVASKICQRRSVTEICW